MRCRGESFADTCADESAILTTWLTLDDFSTCAPYAVKSPEHWVFTRAGVQINDVFGKHSLNQDKAQVGTPSYDAGRPGVTGRLLGAGASGWETDKLSPTASADAVVVATGLNPPSGADMVIRDPSGTRGSLFQVSSIALGGSLLVDDVCSTITKNVLARALDKAG